MGVMDWMDGDDGEESGTVATDGLGFDEDFDDLDGEMGGLEGGMDDFGGAEDDLDGEMDDLDGEMGGFDAGDDLGGTEVDGERVAEIEDRLSELENEVSSISSGMNTVREENKQIGETVEELDDTIRKLLDIYEMVTRGINPFVDDAREMGGLEGDGAFGLFEMEEETEESLDSEVANADAEEFFDEDFGDIDAEADEAELAAEDELTEAEHDDPAASLDDDDGGDESDAGAGGNSFDDLKAEYEENEGWDGEEEVDDEAELDEAAEAASEADETGAKVADEEELEDAFGDDAVEEIEPDETLFEADESAGETADAAGRTTDADDAAAAPASEADSDAESGAYLAELPARYTAESVVLEWTRFLVDVGGAIGAARALRQYRSQGWITRRVERTMSEHVRNAATAGETERPQDLRVEHHRESLTYISRLAGDVAELRSAGGRTTSGDGGTPKESRAAGGAGDVDEARRLDELSALGGGSRGIRR